MPRLTGRQKKYLRGLAHSLKPLVQIGKNALNDGVLDSIDQALGHHELIKIKFVEDKDQKNEAFARIEEKLGCELAGTIGHVGIFYRPARDPDDRQIELPALARDAG